MQTPWVSMLPATYIAQAARTVWEELTPETVKEWIEFDDGRTLSAFTAIGYFVLLCELRSLSLEDVRTNFVKVRAQFSLLRADPLGYLIKIIQMPFTGNAASAGTPSNAQPFSKRVVDALIASIQNALSLSGILNNSRYLSQRPVSTSALTSSPDGLGGLYLSVPGALHQTTQEDLVRQDNAVRNAVCAAQEFVNYFDQPSLSVTLQEQFDASTVHEFVKKIQTELARLSASKDEMVGDSERHPANSTIPHAWEQQTNFATSPGRNNRGSYSLVTGTSAGLVWLTTGEILAPLAILLLGFITIYLLTGPRQRSSTLLEELNRTNSTLPDLLPIPSQGTKNSTVTDQLKLPSHILNVQSDQPNPTTDVGAETARRNTTTDVVKKLNQAITHLDTKLGQLLHHQNDGRNFGEVFVTHIEQRDMLNAFKAFNISAPPLASNLRMEAQFITSLNALRAELNSAHEDLQYLLEIMNSPSLHLGYFSGNSDLEQHLSDVREIMANGSFRAGNRDLWKIVTSGRILTSLHDLFNSEKYERVLAGLHGELQDAVDTRPMAVFSDSFVRIMEKTVKNTFKIGQSNWNEQNAVYQKFNEWRTDVLQIRDAQREPHVTLLGNLRNKLGNGASTVENVMLTMREQAYQATLINKLKELPAALMPATTLQDMKDRSNARMARQQKARLGASIPAFANFANHIVNAQITNNTVQRTIQDISAASEFFAATKVPSSFIISFVEKHFDKKIPLKEAINEVFGATLRKPATSNIPIPMQQLRNGQSISAALHPMSMETIQYLSRRGQESLYSYRGSRESLRETGRQSLFIVSDILSLAINAYKYDHGGQMTQEAEAALVLKLIGDTAYLGATLAPLLVSGRLPTAISRGLLGVGLGSNLIAGIVDLDILSRSGASSLDIGLAAGQFVMNTIATGVSLAFPMAGTLVALMLPNLTSAGQAVAYYEQYTHYKNEGLHQKADIAYRLYQMAIAETVPIVNWFMPLIRAAIIAGSAQTQEGLPSWLGLIARGEMASRQRALISALRRFKEQHPGISNLYYVTPQNMTFDYSMQNPQPFAMPDSRTLQQSRDILVWGVFTERDWHIASGASTALRGQSNNHVRFDTTQFDRALYNRTFENHSRAVSDSQTNPPNMDLFFVRPNSRVPHSSIPALLLNNTGSTHNTIYDIAGISGGRYVNGRGNATFMVDRNLAIDGGEGDFNTASFGNHQGNGTVNITMAKMRNIHIVQGSSASNNVSGTNSRDRYVSDYQPGGGRSDIMNFFGGDDIATANSGTINMGPGNDQLFMTGIPESADGGQGEHDTINFLMLNTTNYDHFGVDGNRIGGRLTSTGRIDTGSLVNFDTLIGPLAIDTDIVTSPDSTLRSIKLGNGTNTINIGRSNQTVRLGNGTNTVNTTLGIAPYDDVIIISNNGNDMITLELVNSQSITISASRNTSNIELSARNGTRGNQAELMFFGGQQTLRIQGDVSSVIHVMPEGGTSDYLDHPGRKSPMFVNCHGVNMGAIDVQVQRNDVQQDANGNLYPLVWILRFGNTVCRLYGYHSPNIVLSTPKDNKAKSLALPSAY